MNPIFRRKSQSQVSDEIPQVSVSPTRNNISENNSLSETSVPVNVESEMENSASPFKLTKTELLALAYDSWRDELTERIEADETTASTHQEYGKVNLTHAHPSGAARLYSYMPIRLSSLIRETKAYEVAKAQLSLLREVVLENEEENGYAPISLSSGIISWADIPAEPRAENSTTGVNESANQSEPAVLSDSEVAKLVLRSAPAIFRSIQVEFLADGDAEMSLSQQVQVNPVILKALRNHGMPSEEIMGLRRMVTPVTDVDDVLARVVNLARMYLPKFSYQQDAVVGCYSSPAQTLLGDLELMHPHLRKSDILAAVAGDKATQEITATPLVPANPEDRLPEVERGVGDHDTAELDIIEAVATGRSLTIDAPPGSERLSTIASLMADAVASGKSVMFVPTRASVGTALKAEFKKLGLSELVLDFSNVEKVPMRIRKGLRLAKPEIDTEAILQTRERLVAARHKLDAFIKDLHTVSPIWGVSVHTLLERLAELTKGEDAPQTRIRFNPETALWLKQAGLERATELLARYAEVDIQDGGIGESAWSNSPVADEVVAEQAVERARRLHTVSIPALTVQLERTANETGLRPALSMAEWLEQIAVLDGIADSFDVFLPKVFETDPEELIIATASKEWREAQGYSMRGRDRRMYRKQAQDMLRPGASPEDLHQALVLVQERRRIWQRYTKDGGGWPTLPTGMAQIRVTCDDVVADLEFLAQQVGIESYLELTLIDLQQQLSALVDDEKFMELLPKRNALLQEFTDHGLMDLVNDFKRRKITQEQVAKELELAYTSSVFEQLINQSTVLATLGPRDISKLLTQFRTADESHIATLAEPLQLAAINAMRDIARSNREKTLKLDTALNNYGVAGLRGVIANYSRLVQASRPIWIVPPVIVAEYIPTMPWVDLVVCDTNDTSSVATLAPTLVRGRQIVVVGDSRRSALIKQVTADGAENVAAGNGGELFKASAIMAFSRVLPVVQLPTNRVQQDQLTIEALRNNGYADVYSSIPVSPRLRDSKLIVVDGRGVPSNNGDGAVEATSVEVEAVVDAVLEYVLDERSGSLAVVTVSPLHAERIRTALLDARTVSGSLEQFIKAHDEERFVVVDISKACGLRRDNIIFSPGFGKTVHGRVLHSFGQLAQPHGFIGLVDAIESARHSMTIISSIGAGEIDFSRVSTPGPRLLAKLLEYAANDAKKEVAQVEVASSPLVADLAIRLEDLGLRVAFSYGDPESITIPLVVGHDDIPGIWAVAVLLDDAQYVQNKSVRSRDRYRYEAFTARGWLVHQTYSSSLFIDASGQADLIFKLVQQVLQENQSFEIEVPTLTDDLDIAVTPKASESDNG